MRVLNVRSLTSKKYLPAWADTLKQPIQTADEEEALIASRGMPNRPTYWARHNDGNRVTIVSWNGKYASMTELEGVSAVIDSHCSTIQTEEI